MTVKDITKILEEIAPLATAEDFDNVGLLVGQYSMPVIGVLITLDALEEVVDEAIEKNCNLIVSFHPIIFDGLKKLNGNTYVERVVIKAIAHKIAIYSMHTALDNSNRGVNAKICEVLDLMEPKILIPKKGALKKLTTYAPLKDAPMVKEALFAAGAGEIGNYSHCSYSLEGLGSFKAGNGAKPTLGKIGELHHERETQINVIYPLDREKNILNALFATHPYEEVAHEVFTLENAYQNLGMGMIGTLEGELDEKEFLLRVKDRMGAAVVRHSRLLHKKVKKVAVLGGSGAFAIPAAIKAGADVLVTSDIKYHQFFQAEDRLVIADIGHFETERFTKDLLHAHLTKKIPNFAVVLSERITNPINYL